jgi:hypothetical protein
MAGSNRDLNPNAFMGAGVCLMGSGVALTVALRQGGAAAVGISLISLGVIFAILGYTKKREFESRDSAGEDDDRPPA